MKSYNILMSKQISSMSLINPSKMLMFTRVMLDLFDAQFGVFSLMLRMRRVGSLSMRSRIVKTETQIGELRTLF